MDEDVLAAARRFPARQGAIEALAAKDEEFRLLCADLAAAEAWLRVWKESSSAERERRCEEYQALVRDLAKEIEGELEVRGNS
jgi:hypothetical protein